MVQHIIASNPVENQYLHLRKTDSHLRAEIKIIAVVMFVIILVC